MTEMREVVIVEAVRTPTGRRNGSLKDVHPVVLAAMALRELMERAKVDPALVEDVVIERRSRRKWRQWSHA